jgi:hypothetical protein
MSAHLNLLQVQVATRVVARICQKCKAVLVAAHVGDSRRQAVTRRRHVALEVRKIWHLAILGRR